MKSKHPIENYNGHKRAKIDNKSEEHSLLHFNHKPKQFVTPNIGNITNNLVHVDHSKPKPTNNKDSSSNVINAMPPPPRLGPPPETSYRRLVTQTKKKPQTPQEILENEEYKVNCIKEILDEHRASQNNSKAR